MRASPILVALLLVPLTPSASAEDACDAQPAEGVFAFPADCFGSVSGAFGNASDEFDFYVPERARVVFHVTNDATDFRHMLLVDLIGPDGLAAAPNVWAGETERAGAVAEQAGIWTLRLDGVSQADVMIPYRFTARLEPAPPPVAPQDDCGLGGDAASAWWAPDLPLPAACDGQLSWSNDPDGYGNDPIDIYRFEAVEGDTLVASAEVPVGAQICFFVYGHEGDGCVKRDEESDPATLSLRVQVLERTSGQMEIYRILPQALQYAFTIDIIEPVWHEQVETRHVTIGADQTLFAGGFFRPEQTIGPAALPEGAFAAWVPLEVAAQPRGSVDLAWSSPLPVDLRVVLADDRRVWVTCDAPLGATSLRCDRETDDGWDRLDQREIVWAGIIVDHGAEVDLTFTYRHWTFG